MAERRLGIWLVGAKGGVATTAILGLIALRRKMTGDWGLVSQLPLFSRLGLADWSQFVVAGHEIRATSLVDEAKKLHEQSRVLQERWIAEFEQELRQIDQRVQPGVLWNVGRTIESLADPSIRRHESPREAIRQVQTDLRRFVEAEQLDGLIVVNVASTEPPVDTARLPQRWADLDRLLDDPQSCPLAASSLYAIAALDLGFPYINFTPSLGSACPAICELAEQRRTCHMGRDGKTGETLMKSVLAPMFAARNLEVMSWVGHNIFGNMDGKVLDDPDNKRSKVASKDQLLGHILGYHPQTHVSIEYIESLGDWKTAWDHIHFRGFLGTPMVLQFIWQGCDSILAAPLVLDLVRFTERAWRAGEHGVLTFLASFFKSPMGVTQHDFVRQFQMLEAWAARQSEAAAQATADPLQMG